MTSKTNARKKLKQKNNDYVHKVARTEAKKVVNKILETKILDNNGLADPVDYNTGLVISLTNTIIRGTAENQYIGDSITPVGVMIRWQVTRSDASQLFRIIIIQNKAGGLPLLSTLLQSVGNITAPLSPYDVDYQSTYRVIYDRLISMDNIRNLTHIGTIKLSAKKLRRINFNDGVGTLESGGLYICCISDSVTATAHPAFDYRARLYYKDA